MPTRFTLLLALCFLPGSVSHAEEVRYDQVDFAVQADTELDNDLAVVVLAAEAEHTDPAQLAAMLNQIMSRGLTLTRAVTNVEARSGDYRTFPVYEKSRLHHWRGVQELTLQSRDLPALNELAGQLQQHMQIKTMSFRVSPERQRATETQLLDQALANFKRTAERIQAGLDAQGYRIVRLSVQGLGAPPPVLPMARMAMLAEADAPPLASEAGSSRLQLNVQATIELQF